MGVSYQTRNRLRRKVQTAPLTAPAAPVAAPEAPAAAAPARARFAWWPLAAAFGVAASAFAFVYRG